MTLTTKLPIQTQGRRGQFDATMFRMGWLIVASAVLPVLGLLVKAVDLALRIRQRAR